MLFSRGRQVAMTIYSKSTLGLRNKCCRNINLLEAVKYPESTILYSSTNKVYGDLKNLKYKEYLQGISVLTFLMV